MWTDQRAVAVGRLCWVQGMFQSRVLGRCRVSVGLLLASHGAGRATILARGDGRSQVLPEQTTITQERVDGQGVLSPPKIKAAESAQQDSASMSLGRRLDEVPVAKRTDGGVPPRGREANCGVR